MRLWRVVGGGDRGLVVRDGRDLESGAKEERLQHGATVEELQVASRKMVGDDGSTIGRQLESDLMWYVPKLTHVLEKMVL